MKKIYIASPYSDPDPQVERLRYQRVCQIVAKLIQKHPDCMFFSPIAHSFGMAKYGKLASDYKFWMEIDRKWIDWADELWVADMEGRETSKGIMMETEYAMETEKPVVWL